MLRQVNVKALISHIVRGDGSDKCRICLGDTSEGQVYLGDTVMLDGDRAVTLSELLETITGVEVSLGGDLPWGLCVTCNQSVMAAADFRTFCQKANTQWHTAVQLINTIPDLENIDHRNSIFAVLQDNQMTVLETTLEDIKEEHYSDSSDQEFLSETENKPVILPRRAFRKRCGCPNCGKTFHYCRQLYEHLKGSTDNQRACFACAKIMSQEDLVLHLKKVHKIKIHACKKCPELLLSSAELKTHLAKSHKPGAYYCGDCGLSFQSAPALHGHMTLHLKKNCPSCNKLFRNRKCYTIHVKECCNLDYSRKDTRRTKSRVLFEVKNAKDNKKLYVGARGSADEKCICDYCNKQFAGKKFVSAHIQIVHMKNTHRPCHYCGKSYAAAHMTEHIKKHEEVLSFKCDLCGVVLKTKLGYIQHLRLHTGEKPYKCKYCSETFSASSRRSEHVRKYHKHPEELILKHCCEVCPAKFRLPYRLKQHMDTVHNVKDNVKKFECTECHIRFSSCRGLLYHSRKHQSYDFISLKKSDKK